MLQPRYSKTWPGVPSLWSLSSRGCEMRNAASHRSQQRATCRPSLMQTPAPLAPVIILEACASGPSKMVPIDMSFRVAVSTDGANGMVSFLSVLMFLSCRVLFVWIFFGHVILLLGLRSIITRIDCFVAWPCWSTGPLACWEVTVVWHFVVCHFMVCECIGHFSQVYSHPAHAPFQFLCFRTPSLIKIALQGPLQRFQDQSPQRYRFASGSGYALIAHTRNGTCFRGTEAHVHASRRQRHAYSVSHPNTEAQNSQVSRALASRRYTFPAMECDSKRRASPKPLRRLEPTLILFQFAPFSEIVLHTSDGCWLVLHSGVMPAC